MFGFSSKSKNIESISTSTDDSVFFENITTSQNIEDTTNTSTDNPNSLMSSIDADELNRIVEYLSDYYSQPTHMQVSYFLDGSLSREDFLVDVVTQIGIYDFNKQLNKDTKKDIANRFINTMVGYDVIDDILKDNTISDIKILSYDRIRVKRLGKRETISKTFSSRKEYLNFVNLVASKNKINIGAKNAIKPFTDKKTCEDFILRFNITTGLINSSEQPCIHIRKIPKAKPSLDDLIEAGMINEEKKQYLLRAITESSGILFTGKGASGKTTLMNACLEHIPHTNSGLVIQESEELFDDNHPDLMFQHILQNQGEGSIEYTLKDLTVNGLLTDIDYFIIGEIKGDEAAYFLNASYTGHKCWCSVHGVNSTEAINKLADYVSHETNYSHREILSMLKYMKVIVFLENFKVKEISEITGFDTVSGELIYTKIY